MMNNIGLAEMARKAGICKEGFERIASSGNVEELLHYYIEGIDFCLEHDFPSKEYLKENGNGMIEKHGIFIDTDASLMNMPVTVLLGSSSASLNYNHYSVSQLFVKHSSTAKVNIKDNAYLVIDCFEGSLVDIIASGNSKVIVNVYGNAEVLFHEKDVSAIKVIRKEKAKY